MKMMILFTILFSYLFWFVSGSQSLASILSFALCIFTVLNSYPMMTSLDWVIFPEVTATPFCLSLAFLSTLVILITFLATKAPSSMFNLTHWFMLCVLYCIFTFKGTLNYFMLCEVSLIPISLIILGWGYQPERSLAFSYMFIYTFCFALPLLAIMILIGSQTNQWVVSQFNTISQSNHSEILTGFKLILMIMTISSFMVKFPMYSVHLWLPKAHVEAPVSGSMILAGLLLKIGGFGWFLMMPLMTSSPGVWVFTSFSLIGGTLISLACLRQVDMKVIIAYSSIAHLGFVIGAFTSDSSLGFIGGVLVMLTHGLSSPGMFYSANVFYSRSGSRNILMNSGSVQFTPLVIIFWFLLCMANMSAPPSSNLVAELFVISSMMNNSVWVVFQMGLMILLAGAYTLVLYSSSSQGQKKSKARALMQLSQSEISVFCTMVVTVYGLSFIIAFL